MTAMTLTEFLLARIAEVEAVARACDGESWEYAATTWGAKQVQTVGDKSYAITCDSEGLSDSVAYDDAGEHIARHDPAWILADCDSKRQIVELHGENSTIPGRETLRCWVCSGDYPCTTLRLLALPYSGHPQYHANWRPE